MQNNKSHQGKLYLVASPLGNLGDASSRLQQVLHNCNLVAAEDTRVARKLLTALGIAGKKIISIRQQNEAKAAAKITADAGQTIAYLCDAGTPGISDPGAVLVSVLREQGFAIITVPGPSAVTAALSVSGFANAGFVFGGFLSRRRIQRINSLSSLVVPGLPLVLFEAPGRIADTLQDMADFFGPETRVCLCRELTKKFEQTVVGNVAQLLEQLAAATIVMRGEFTLVVDVTTRQISGDTAQALRTAKLLATELPLPKACKLAAKISNGNAKQLYQHLSADHDRQQS